MRGVRSDRSHTGWDDGDQSALTSSPATRSVGAMVGDVVISDRNSRSVAHEYKHLYDLCMDGDTINPNINPDSVDALLDDVAGHLNAQHGRLIDLTVWLLANPFEWQGDGVWTAAQFLAWRCGVSASTARSVVEAAERASELPESIELVRRGELSLDQLTPIVRAVPAWGDAQVASLAPRLTVAQLRRVCRDTSWNWSPGGIDAEEVPAAEESAPGADTKDAAAIPTDPFAEAAPLDDENRVSSGWGPDGRWWLHADLDADLGAQIEASLNDARDRLFRDLNHGGEQAPLTLVSDVDAFVAVAQAAVDVAVRRDRRDRFRVNLFMDPTGALLTTQHVAVPDSIKRLITCDGRIDPVFVDGSIPVSVGRSQRIIPDRLRRVVLFRDEHRCQVPGCTATRGLDLHHIIHWSDDGPTDSWNLITICSRHHRMHHTHRLGISGNADRPDTLRFVNAHGVEIRRSGAKPTAPSAPPSPIAGEYQHPIGERLDGRWITFVPPDDREPPHTRHDQDPEHGEPPDGEPDVAC